ncbi:helix-turn-helix domain-containing protein [uncultured Cellulomonas sp.]|uniref:AlbA family DNA-binding domain-containing protein n=1 Tax=uncultured Cellulomonas sp. TaxID=189682 RepID=UPI00261D6CC6|nr:ATP-binding protein [uncultured Cellulomonas sp.]
MTLWRDPELESILGGPLDAAGLTETALQALVGAKAREGERLEFKSHPYPPSPPGAKVSWTAAQEFAKDVCALANQRGGLILIGVHEEGETATSLDATVTDPGATEQRLRQALANHATPQPRIAFVPVPATTGGNYLAVIVRPSPSAPHAVTGKPGDGRRPLHYPVRDGADVRWMAETEVAQRYRGRIDGQAARAVRTRAATDGGLDALRRGDGLWLYVCISPHSPAEATLDRTAARDAQAWWRSYSFATPHQRMLEADGRAIPAPGRVTVTAPPYRNGHEATDPRFGYLELYIDGTSFAATPVAFNTQDDADGSQVGDVTLAEDTVLAVNACLTWTVRQAGAWGAADVLIGLVDADAADGELTRPVTLVGVRHGDLVRIGDRKVPVAPEAVTVADLAVAGQPQGRLLVAHDALAVLLHNFGIAEPAQLAADGTVVTETWNLDPREVERWARDHGVTSRRLPEN